jgi:cytochrome c-type biogenesis protein
VEIQVSLPLAFAAGLLSFASPCVLPVVPSYLAFITGLTLGELQSPTDEVRRRLVLQSVLFVVGFSLVFMTMGLAATALGTAIAWTLPWLTRLGGAVVVVLGLYLLGVLRTPALDRELRVRMSSRPQGAVGVLFVGVAFGAGWTPCIGPILASILLYAGLEATMAQGFLLLSVYAVGLGLPFVIASVAFNWFVSASAQVRRFVVPLQRGAGGVLVVMGVLMVSGHFTTMTAALAGMGQLINLDLP